MAVAREDPLNKYSCAHKSLQLYLFTRSHIHNRRHQASKFRTLFSIPRNVCKQDEGWAPVVS